MMPAADFFARLGLLFATFADAEYLRLAAGRCHRSEDDSGNGRHRGCAL